MRFDVSGLSTKEIERILSVLCHENVFLYRYGVKTFLAEQTDIIERNCKSNNLISQKFDTIL